jgi:hypothetical protein
MPRKKVKPIKYPNIDSFPEGRITANMIRDSYIGGDPNYIRAAIREGKLAGVCIGKSCFMTKEQFKKNYC